MTSRSRKTAASPDGSDRRLYIGGSDAASALGISPWRSRFRCWAEKVGEEVVPNLALREWIHWGNLLEPVVATEFETRTEMKVRVERRFLTHPKFPWMGGHIDRRIIKAPGRKPAFLECKTSNAFDYRNWGDEEAGVDGVPLHYVAQCDHYLHAMDGDCCYLAVLIGGNDFRTYFIERNAKREAMLVDAERSLWDAIQTRTPPDVDNEADAKLRWKLAIEGSAMPIDAAERSLVVQLSRTAERRKQAEAHEKDLRNKLFPLFQDREALTYNGEIVADLTCYTQNRIDTDALKEKRPKIAKMFLKPIPVKKLNIRI